MIQAGDRVSLGPNGPEMVVWKIVEQKAYCHWIDAFGEKRGREFLLRDLVKIDRDGTGGRSES